MQLTSNADVNTQHVHHTESDRKHFTKAAKIRRLTRLNALHHSGLYTTETQMLVIATSLHHTTMELHSDGAITIISDIIIAPLAAASSNT